MARRKADGLMEIGIDAFASLDDYYGRNTQAPNYKPAKLARKKADGLMEIGKDAFASLDEYHGRNTGQAPRQGRQPYQQPHTNVWRNYNDNSKPAAAREVLNCNEAAKTYGGVLFKEPGRKKKPFFGFSFGFPKAK